MWIDVVGGGLPVDPDDDVVPLGNHLEPEELEWRKRRFAEVSSYFRGKHVRITTVTESFTGITSGLEPSGVLRVARDDGRGTEPVLSGDVAEAP